MKRALAWLLILPLFSCAKSENISTFSIELASVSMDGSCSDTEDELPVAVTCIGVSLCRRDGADCTPMPLYRSSDDHGGPGAQSIRLGRLAAATFALDARTESGPHEVNVVAYDESGHVFATGVARDVRLDGAPIRVRLQRSDEWSCGPAHADIDGAPLQSRALHAATAMPNGDVLIYGGVTGDEIDISGFATGAQGASLERSVEVYDASEDRFYVASVSDPLGFGRVFFASELATLDDEPPYKIHVFGGYSIATGAVLRVDGSQSSAANSTGLPFVPTAEASPAESVTFLYDPVTHHVDVEPLGGTGGFTTGFPAVTGFLDDANPSLLITGAGAFTGATSQTTLSDEISWVGHEGAPVSGSFPALLQGRAGATVSVFPNAHGAALVWGGNIGNALLADVRSHAGELVRLSFPDVLPVPGGNADAASCATMANSSGAPEPTVFHSATTLDGGIVVAGGLYVGAAECPMHGVRTTFNNDQPITVFSISGTTITATRAISGDFVGTAFHSATRLDANHVMLVGGAFSGMLNSDVVLPLTAFDQVGVVGPGHTSTDGFLYTSSAPLMRARFGHAAAILPGGRVLVTGGFERFMSGASAKLRAFGSPEVIQLGVSEPNLEGAQCDDVAFGSM